MRRLIPLLLLAMVLSACKIRVDTALVINEDESGSITLEVSLDEELRQLADQGDGGALSDLSVSEDVPEGWVFEDFVNGEFEGVRASAEFDDLAGLNERLGQLADQADGSDNIAPDFISQLSISRAGEVFDFSADLTGLEEGLGAAVEGGEDGGLGIDPSAFLTDLFEIRLIVTMPGSIVSSNADATADSTLTWNIAITDDGRLLEAQSSLGGGGGGAIGLIVLAAVVAIVVFVLIQRRSQSGGPDPAVDEAATAE